MKYLLLFTFLSIQLFAQKTQTFLAKEYTNLKTENVWLIQPFGKKYSFFDFEKGNQVKVINKENFSFEGNLKFPTLFLVATDDFVSEAFFLDNNNKQKIDYSQNENSKTISLKISGSPSNEEYIKLNKLIKESVVKDSLRKEQVNKGVEDYIITDYIKKNPDSYVALWLLIKEFSDNTPNRYQKEALTYFSDSMKKSELYQSFIERISSLDLFQKSLINGFTLKNKEKQEELITLGDAKKICVDRFLV